MTQEKSEDLIVPEGRRKPTPTRELERCGGGKEVSVKRVDSPHGLKDATAESPRPDRGAEGGEGGDLSPLKPRKAPKASLKTSIANPTELELVVASLTEAFDKVAANKGAPGPDRQTIDAVRKHWPSILSGLRRSILDGSYLPGDIRRVWIPKGGGKMRGLGIPNVIDRVVQEAVRMVLEPMFEPTFHESSHGFRPNRGCQTAITQAKNYVEQGYNIVVDMDLEKFFDKVHRQRLLARLSQRVGDKRVVALITKMFKAKVIMPDGLAVATEEGVPQGGPLSPLLSNIVLDELDWELDRRGHRFVRYADDCNIYVKSERAGQRVLASVERFINRRLRLTLNADKSAVGPPDNRHFLGYRLFRRRGNRVWIGLSERSVKRLNQRIVELTPRAGGRSLESVIEALNVYFGGWLGHFGICTGIRGDLDSIDSHIRRRLRAIVLKHWKRKRTIARRLIAKGVKPKTAWRCVYRGRLSLWALSNSNVVRMALPNSYFEERGFKPLEDRFRENWAMPPVPVQLALPW